MNSKNKGNTFERKISKLLSERFKEKTGIDNSFRRNIDSGSFFGGTNQHRASSYDTSKATFGDIICPDGFKFNLECKHYKTPPAFTSIVKKEVKQWDDWLSQATQDAENAKLSPLLIVKYNGVEEIVFLDHVIANVPILFPYKEFSAYKLKDFLTMTDGYFFV